MAARALADFLTDFGAPSAVEDARQPRLAVVHSAPAIDTVEVEIRIADAVARARADWAAEAEADWASRQADIENRHAVQMAEIQTMLSRQAADLIAERFAALEHTLLEQTGGTVSRILATALSDGLRDRAVKALATTVRGVLMDGETLRARMSGPVALHDAFLAHVGTAVARIDYTETDAIDLTVAIDDALYATRLGEWSDELAQVMA